ncbi:MAG: hypothetical protein ACK48S_09770 [Planctomycetia bacterium]
MTHDEMIAVIQHHVKRGEIQYRAKGLSTWQAAATPNWDFSRYDFRAKPEPLVIYADCNDHGHPLFCSHEKYTPPFGRKLRKFVEVTE